jgi:hypothetical protein
MDLTISGSAAWSKDGNGVVMNGGRIGTKGNAAKVIDALKASGQSAFEIWMAPANLSQSGPARMISIGGDTSYQNFVLGQIGKDVQVRLLHTGKDARCKPRLETTNNFVTTSLTHLVHTYDGNTENLYINGVLQSVTVNQPGDYSNWDANDLFNIGNEAGSNRPWYGSIYLVAVYNRALSATEIDVNFQAGANPGNNQPSSPSGSLPFEVGEVQLDHNWVRVNFNKPFGDPVVVANPLSIDGGEPAVIRIHNVDSNGFEIRIQEWDYLDGIHVLETASYLVMERGSYTLADGTRIEADTFETNKVESIDQQNFNQAFQETPVVISSIASFNGSDTVTGRMRNISTQGFEYCMQEQDLNSPNHMTESINYIAWEPSSGNIGGYTYEVSKTADVVTHKFHTIQFGQNFADIPALLADMQTADGMDAAGIRWQNKDANSVEIQIDEEKSKDKETNHTTEVVGYMVFSR